MVKMFHITCIAMPLQCHGFTLQTNKKKLPSPGVYTDAKNQQCSMLSDSDDDDDDDDDDDHDRYFLA